MDDVSEDLAAILASRSPTSDAGDTDLTERFRAVRSATEAWVITLSAEDQAVQSMPDASPAKWHRAHTTWFFEQFVLTPHVPGYRVFDPDFAYLFNSYYEAVGPRHARPSRGLLTRPPADRVTAYRQHVDAAMTDALPSLSPEVLAIVELGLHHEQQHQELLVTDILHAFSCNPLYPALLPGWTEPVVLPDPNWVEIPGGLAEQGHAKAGFCFDNEQPVHRVWLEPFAIASHPVRNSDWQAFIDDGGYQTSTLWMSDGWADVQANDWDSPFYWRRRDGAWWQFGPGGLAPLVPDAPVRHVSWYEADAFARWSGERLPTEAEWEASATHAGLGAVVGSVWQWTESAYRPYPGYRPAPGAIGEYNGKFMINQMVLRGGSLATPPGHVRISYRNFFHPDKRWQFSGLRLAKDL
ncbi:MAG TPA: ergothioneine biosynthesis protein EgtB [Rhodopila sp.]|uniref:ergothioneine biosynthesis protein EgtB n=1 Tax=Rhodopila sp. TaxID=2480087 RepID=UPI002BC73D60|nr:ergothioneine biosynthesis protein EgtB [Rhodopila sp.]HVY15386.1 ergothioneine biosynthesis protein EgtB [Rhodopila sp.]